MIAEMKFSCAHMDLIFATEQLKQDAFKMMISIVSIILKDTIRLFFLQVTYS